MKVLEQINLKNNETGALEDLKKRLSERFPSVEIILFGSKARGDFDSESDFDLLVLIDNAPDSRIEEEIVGISYDIELMYDVVFGIIVENKDYWDSPLARAMPLHWNVDKDGVRV